MVFIRKDMLMLVAGNDRNPHCASHSGTGVQRRTVPRRPDNEYVQYLSVIRILSLASFIANVFLTGQIGSRVLNICNGLADAPNCVQRVVVSRQSHGRRTLRHQGDDPSVYNDLCYVELD